MKAEEMILCPERRKLTKFTEKDIEEDTRTYQQKRRDFSFQFEGSKQARLAMKSNRSTKIVDREIDSETPQKDLSKILRHEHSNKKKF